MAQTGQFMPKSLLVKSKLNGLFIVYAMLTQFLAYQKSLSVRTNEPLEDDSEVLVNSVKKP